jgi:hypothetical protein
MQHRLRGCQLAAQLRGNLRSLRFWNSFCTHASSRYTHHSPHLGFIPCILSVAFVFLLRVWLFIAMQRPVD